MSSKVQFHPIINWQEQSNTCRCCKSTKSVKYKMLNMTFCNTCVIGASMILEDNPNAFED